MTWRAVASSPHFLHKRLVMWTPVLLRWPQYSQWSDKSQSRSAELFFSASAHPMPNLVRGYHHYLGLYVTFHLPPVLPPVLISYLLSQLSIWSCINTTSSGPTWGAPILAHLSPSALLATPLRDGGTHNQDTCLVFASSHTAFGCSTRVLLKPSIRLCLSFYQRYDDGGHLLGLLGLLSLLEIYW